jgi:NAD(P)-dependent dehydrogenase (short-subunit alcohol dehydrogenase family)
MTRESKDLMTGNVCMVTGATSGIGLVTAHELARLGAVVIVVGRDPEKGHVTITNIQKETGNPAVHYLNADFASLSQVRKLATDFQSQFDRLDVLINNAGAFFFRRALSEDGFEKTFAVNHLSFFLLTSLLLDTLKASAPARIVNVSSNGHYGAALDFDDLQGEKGIASMQAYGRSKFANVLFTYELARRLEGSGVTANVLHPGFVRTNMGKNNGWLARLLIPLFQLRGISPEEGARTSIYLASSPDVEGISGKYYVKGEAVPSDPATYDEGAARRLWEISVQMVGLDASV